MTGRDFAADNRGLLDELAWRGMARLENGRFALTRRGMLVSNAIIEQCFERIPQQPETSE